LIIVFFSITAFTSLSRAALSADAPFFFSLEVESSSGGGRSFGIWIQI
jgi:hypothetical protein